MARKTKRIVTLPGYVQYLRTSDEEAQAPERSQDGQRRDIGRLLQSYCDLPNLGARVLLFLDPNGVTLEFCEKLPVSQ